jgi:hypothetical protein
MNHSIATTARKKNGRNLPRAIAKEKNGIVLYWVEELSISGIHAQGIAKLLGCELNSINNTIKTVEEISLLEAEIVTTHGLKVVKLIHERDLAKLLRQVSRGKAKLETRNRADDVRDQLAAAGFKLAVMLELAPEQLASQAIANSEEKQTLILRRDILRLEDKTLSLRHYVVTALPKPIADRILGVTEITNTITKEVVVNDRGQILGHLPGESFNKKELCERYGIVTKSGKPDYKQINAYLDGLNLPNEAWEDRQVVSHNAQLKTEFLPQLDKLLGRVDRQSLLGE